MIMKLVPILCSSMYTSVWEVKLEAQIYNSLWRLCFSPIFRRNEKKLYPYEKKGPIQEKQK